MDKVQANEVEDLGKKELTSFFKRYLKKENASHVEEDKFDEVVKEIRVWIT